MNKDELKALSIDSLDKEITSMRKELFALRMNVISGQVKDFSQFKKLKTGIARALTFLNEKRK